MAKGKNGSQPQKPNGQFLPFLKQKIPPVPYILGRRNSQDVINAFEGSVAAVRSKGPSTKGRARTGSSHLGSTHRSPTWCGRENFFPSELEGWKGMIGQNSPICAEHIINHPHFYHSSVAKEFWTTQRTGIFGRWKKEDLATSDPQLNNPSALPSGEPRRRGTKHSAQRQLVPSDERARSNCLSRQLRPRGTSGIGWLRCAKSPRTKEKWCDKIYSWQSLWSKDRTSNRLEKMAVGMQSWKACVESGRVANEEDC